MTGAVAFVGAGPGGVETLTLRGAALLRDCEVCLYDRLVDPSILCLCPAECQLIDVGKRGGGDFTPQEEINGLLIQWAQTGKRVVRLKGGDPSLFGRLTEELDALSGRGISFEVVPGVTAASGLAAWVGFPLTDRRQARGVSLLTLRGADGPLEPDWQSLVRGGHTLVFYMSLHSLERAVKGLMAGGMDGGVPVAVVSSGGRPEGRTVFSRLDRVALAVRQAGLKAPATVFVGQALSRRFVSAPRPFEGRSVLLLAPAHRESGLLAPLQSGGARVFHCPAFFLRPRFSPLPTCADGLFFSSPYAVACWVKALIAQGKSWADYADAFLLAPGSGTLRALRATGWKEGRLLSEVPAFEGRPSVWMVGNSARGQGTVRALESLGARVQFCDLYDEVPRPLPDFARSLLDEGGIDALMLTSAAQAEVLPRAGAGSPTAFCIGPLTAAAAAEKGYETRTAPTPSLEALLSLFAKEKKRTS